MHILVKNTAFLKNKSNKQKKVGRKKEKKKGNITHTKTKNINKTKGKKNNPLPTHTPVCFS